VVGSAPTYGSSPHRRGRRWLPLLGHHHTDRAPWWDWLTSI